MRLTLNEENFWYFNILEIPIIVEMNVLPEVNELPVQSDQSESVVNAILLLKRAYD